MLYVVFYVWLLELSMSLRFTHVVYKGNLFFILLKSIPLYGCTTTCLFSCGGHLHCFQFGAIMNKAAINIPI